MNERKTKLIYSKETLALGVAHAIYRNTEVEDYHSEARLMDEEFYHDVYRIVSNKSSMLINVEDYLNSLCSDGLSEESLRNNNHTSEENIFLLDVLFGIQCSNGWDMPEKMDESPENDLAGFFLGGTFKRYCDGKHFFNDSVMKTINKDIANRVYCYLEKNVLI